MHRFLVALLAALDAAVSAIVGWAAVLAPLMVMWVFAFGGLADWSALWPASVRIWQLGNFVPLVLTLDGDFLVATGLPEEAGSFVLSIAPLAFAVLIAVFAARSGRRALRSGRWFTGVVAGTATTAIAATVGNLTAGSNPVTSVEPWQAILLPTLLYAIPMLLGAVTGAWSEGDDGVVDRLHDAADRLPAGWREFPALMMRGGGMALAGVIGFAALAIAVAVPFSGGRVIALYEASQVDLTGSILLTIAQFAYLPTLIGWAVAWIAGPGFMFGAGTGVSPAATQLGVLPGVPMLGLIPEHGSPLLLLAVLAPVVAGAIAGWGVRIAFRAEAHAEGSDHEPVVPRVMLAAGIAVIAGAGAALIAALTSGSLGPGRLAQAGPEPGAIALATGLEVMLGAAILLLAPRAYEQRLDRWVRGEDEDEPADRRNTAAPVD
ncbi:cell division protein PerM [Microbacterium rhizophilus]|uniref:cell division protein PerM n=1 Tax=Microbacterium rhizophilus TaxID=3138934 RepID=UPI0031EDA2BF